VTVLNQIYEEDFLGFSYGFRPERRQHDALDALWVGIMIYGFRAGGNTGRPER
jgi:retron-type reverse transcriptase